MASSTDNEPKNVNSPLAPGYHWDDLSKWICIDNYGKNVLIVKGKLHLKGKPREKAALVYGMHEAHFNL